MTNKKLFGTSGIRGNIGSEINSELALKIGKSLAKYLNNTGKIPLHETRRRYLIMTHLLIKLFIPPQSDPKDPAIRERYGTLAGGTGIALNLLLFLGKLMAGLLTGSVAVVIEQFKNVLTRFVEATAVMIVTTCLIPVLVILFFVWVVKTLFGIPIVIPAAFPGKPKRKSLPYGHGNE